MSPSKSFISNINFNINTRGALPWSKGHCFEYRAIRFVLYFFLAYGVMSAALLRPIDAGAEPLSIFSAGDPVIEDIRFLAREAGRSLTSLTPPLSRDEAALFLSEFDEETLSPAGRGAYNRIRSALTPKTLFSSGFFSLAIHTELTGEMRARTNTAITWEQYAYRFKDAPPFLTIPISLFFGDAVQLFIEPSLNSDPSAFDEEGAVFGTNLPYKPGHFDLNIPLRAFLAIGGPWWSFELGRDRVSFGVGRTGNMAVSDTPDYYDMARVSLFSSVLKYSLLISQTPLHLFGPGGDSLLTDNANTPNFEAGGLMETTNRYLYIHRLDIRIFKKVSLALTEGVMVGNSPLELRFLNPLMVFHSFFSWRDHPEWNKGADRSSMTGSLFSFDIEWAVLPSLAVYGQFVLNELSTQYEADNHPESQAPNATGYLAGIEIAHDVSGWCGVFWGEFAYMDPFLYTLSSPFASYIWMRRLAEVGEKPLRYTWIGHPQGRDTILFAVGSSLSRDELTFKVDVSFTLKGERGIRWDWGMGEGYNDQTTPSGVVERRLATVIGSTWRALPQVTLSGRIGGAYIFNDGRKDDEYGGFLSLAVQAFF
jgi:hypothetical protein